MKKIIVLLAIGVAAVFHTHAQTPNNSLGDNDPKAKAVLDKVSTKYKAYTSVKATFTLSMEDTKGVKKEDPQSGTLWLKGTKYKIDLTDQEITSDNSTMWTYMKDVNEVQISDYEASPDDIDPSKIFTIYEKGFLYRLNADVIEGGVTYYEIELTPTDKEKSQFFKVKMYVNKSDNSVYKAKIYTKDSMVLIYKINSFAANPTITDDFFKFDQTKHPGITVTDLR